jgi:hypothetical protein
MALIVENGSLVSGANSYVTLVEARAYASARGIALSAIDGDLEAVVLKAMDYLESFSDRFRGTLVDRDQALAWPRAGVEIEDFTWASTEIPRQVISAELALIIEVHDGVDHINPVTPDMPVISERVEGAVEVKYANPGQQLKVSKTQKSQAIINLLLKNSGMFSIRSDYRNSNRIDCIRPGIERY